MAAPISAAAPPTSAVLALASTYSESDKKVASSDKKFDGQMKTKDSGAMVLSSSASGVAGTAITAAGAAAASSGSIPLKERRVAVVNFASAGLGDFSAGIKFLRMLRDHIGIPQNRLCIFTDTQEQNIKLFNNENWDIKSFRGQDLEVIKDQIDKLGIQLLVVGPTDDQFDRMEKWAVPKALFREYGFRGENAMGLRKDQLGIFIDDILKKDKKTLQAFDPTQPRLFLGYSHDKAIRTAFLVGATQSVFEFEKASCDLNFIVADLFTSEAEFKKKSEELTGKLKAAGADSVRYIKLAAFEEESGKSANENLKGRRVTIVRTSAIVPVKFRELMKKAYAVLGTGDQSPSEAISGSIPFIYDCLIHKQSFMHDFKDILFRHSKKLKSLFAKVLDSPNSENIALFLSACNGSKKANWQNFIDEIHAKHDLLIRLPGHLEAALKNDPLVGTNFTSYAELDPKAFKGDLQTLPFDKEFLISEDQVSELEIDPHTNLSRNKKFAGSRFTYSSWGSVTRVIKRLKA
jgi:hypothetical protein